MNIEFELNIKKAFEVFEKIFASVEFSKEIIRENDNVANVKNILNSNDIEEINYAIELLNKNARITETRRMQQAYFGNTLKNIGSQNIKEQFEQDKDFRIQYLMLLFVFKIFASEEDKNIEHHRFIIKAIDDSIVRLLA